MRWLEEKLKEDGVRKLASGLRYKILVSGSEGWAKSPLAHSQCKFSYTGSLTPANGGREFDSGELSTTPNDGIKGWTEALQLMKEGDTFEIYLPPELGYGDEGSAMGVPAGAVLVFTIALQEVQGGTWGKDFKRFEFPPSHHPPRKNAKTQDRRASDPGRRNDDRVFGRVKTEL